MKKKNEVGLTIVATFIGVMAIIGLFHTTIFITEELERYYHTTHTTNEEIQTIADKRIQYYWEEEGVDCKYYPQRYTGTNKHVCYNSKTRRTKLKEEIFNDLKSYNAMPSITWFNDSETLNNLTAGGAR